MKCNLFLKAGYLPFLRTRFPRRHLHVMPTLPFSLTEGVMPFLPASSVQLLVEQHCKHLKRVNQAVQGTELASLSLFQLLERIHGDSRHAVLLHHAGQAWNMDFWLQALSARRVDPIDKLVAVIERDFGSWSQFQTQFTQSALAMVASGWTWLVKSPNGHLRIINTYNGSPLFPTRYLGSHASSANTTMASEKVLPGGSSSLKGTNGLMSLQALLGIGSKTIDPAMTVQTEKKLEESIGNNRIHTPIIGLSMWEHAYLPSYGLDRERYVEQFWNNVNWNRAAVILNIF